MSGYTDTPSMDEILLRIKHALADRDARSNAECGAGSAKRDVEEAGDFGDDYLVRPAVAPKGTAPKGDGVVVLTPSQKVKRTADIAGVDLGKLAEALAFKMGRELGIPYLTPKIEKWIIDNFSDVVKEIRK